MTSPHKTYDTEFKLEVARLVAEQGLGVPEVMKSTGAGKTAIHRWEAQYRAEKMGQSGMGTPLRLNSSEFANWNPKTGNSSRITTY